LQALLGYRPLQPVSNSTASTVGTVSSDSTTSSSDLEVRVKQMEKSLDSMKHHHNAERVDEALKNVSILAGRPLLVCF